MFKGKLIVIEGIDHVGKTTLSRGLAEELKATWMNFPARSTFYGKLIDSWLRGLWEAKASTAFPELDNVNAAVFQALQTCNRLECVPTIEHLLLTGENIICDRYWPSGVAYGCADGLDKRSMVTLHRTLPYPDLFILLDAPLDVIKSRAGAKLDRYESLPVEYHATVQTNYQLLFREQAASSPWVWTTVNAGGTIDEVQALLQQTVRRHLGDWV